MPRKMQVTTQEIYRIRGDWWQKYVQARQFVRSLPDNRRQAVGRLVDDLNRPKLDHVTGCPLWISDITGRDTTGHPSDAYRLAATFGLDVDFLIWWFWSEEGWRALDNLWQELPEVIHIPLCTKQGVFPSCTHIEYVYAPYELK